jgi:hypothetical protein
MILRVPPSSVRTPELTGPALIRSRLTAFHQHDFSGLVAALQDDIMLLQAQNDTPRKPRPDDTLASKLTRAAGFLSQNKIGKAKQSILSTGLGDPTSASVIAQFDLKHPRRDYVIPELTVEQVVQPCATIAPDDLRSIMRRLDPDSAPGLGGCCNSHLKVLLLDKVFPDPDDDPVSYTLLPYLLTVLSLDCSPTGSIAHLLLFDWWQAGDAGNGSIRSY